MLRLYAPSDEKSYVLVPASGQLTNCLVINREDATASLSPASALDSLIGKVGARAKSCALVAIVGLFQFPDDHSLVIVTEGTERPIATERGAGAISVVTKTAFLPLKARSGQPEDVESPEAVQGGKQRYNLKEFLEAGDFFYAAGTPVTHTLQRCARLRRAGDDPLHIRNADERFVWNRSPLRPLREAGDGPWLTPVMRGAVLTEQMALPSGGQLLVCLISRRSVEHAGTRFKTRGIDDDGACANFVETEQILCLSGGGKPPELTSLVQARGSVPVFWEQRGKQLTPKPRVIRELELTLPALRVHLASLLQAYGTPILLSLLEQKGDEADLAAAFVRCIRALAADAQDPLSVRLCAFDFHASARASKAEGARALIAAVGSEAAAQGHFAISVGKPTPLREQKGIVRTNCLDCLNRTNIAQTWLALQSAATQLAELADDLSSDELSSVDSSLQATLRRMWGDTGDVLSVQYTGFSNLSSVSKSSGLEETNVRRSFVQRAGQMVEKGVKAANRYIQEQFLEDNRQQAIDLMLYGGQRSHARSRGFTTDGSVAIDEPLTFFAGTWNVNGKEVTEQYLMAWFSEPRSGLPAESAPSVYAIGFQEFVDLSAQNLVRDDSKRRIDCKMKVEAVLQRLHGGKYVAVRVEQMVGVLLLVYVKPELAGLVRGVFADCVKTGFGGNAGNKGGVAVRMQLGGATVCIINTHLDAGQSKPEERNATYHEVLKGLTTSFSTARGGPFAAPLDHDLCLWVGDLNYRLELPNDEVRRRIAARQWDSLLASDQLTIAQRNGSAFSSFREATIGFQPTYKYDSGTSVYDTSEKQRVPSWTDRVLWHGEGVGAQAYVACQDITRSDHKPVAALLLWSPPMGSQEDASQVNAFGTSPTLKPQPAGAEAVHMLISLDDDDPPPAAAPPFTPFPSASAPGQPFDAPPFEPTASWSEPSLVSPSPSLVDQDTSGFADWASSDWFDASAPAPPVSVSSDPPAEGGGQTSAQPPPGAAASGSLLEPFQAESAKLFPSCSLFDSSEVTPAAPSEAPRPAEKGKGLSSVADLAKVLEHEALAAFASTASRAPAAKAPAASPGAPAGVCSSASTASAMGGASGGGWGRGSAAVDPYNASSSLRVSESSWTGGAMGALHGNAQWAACGPAYGNAGHGSLGTNGSVGSGDSFAFFSGADPRMPLDTRATRASGVVPMPPQGHAPAPGPKPAQDPKKDPFASLMG